MNARTFARAAGAGLLLTLVLAACGSDVSSSPPATGSPVAQSATPAPTANVVASPAAVGEALAFPSVTGEMLAAGRYRSSPPFDVDFTFEVPDGWESMHLHGEFFDIGWFGDAPRPGPPEKWIAFGLPEHVQGAEDVPVGDLTPAEAVELLRSRTDLTATEPEAFTLDGRDGLRLDLHAAEPNTVLFGGPAGEFGIEPSQDVRIGFVPHGDRLLAVLVLAAPDALDAAWADAQPILDSVELP